MSFAQHFETLARYGAQAMRVVPSAGEPEDMVVEGGGLAAAWARLGRGPALTVLRDPQLQELLLADGPLAVTLRREADGLRLVVRDGERVLVDEALESPPPAPSHAGPWFRPDLQQELPVGEAVRDAGHAVVLCAEAGVVRAFRRGWHGPGAGALPVRASLPAVHAEELGADAFRERFGVRMAYVAGAMAGGIASEALVVAMAEAGLLAFFGSGGLPVPAVKAAAARLAERCQGLPWGMNLLHNPVEPSVELETVDAYLAAGVPVVEASAFMGLTPAIVRYRAAGLSLAADGSVHVGNRVIAKVSRPEVAAKFFAPAPADLLAGLVEQGLISAAQAELAGRVPVVDAVTVEGDSGGHTDHRPLLVLLPLLRAQRDRLCGALPRAERPLVGAAGGLGTPGAMWAAFAAGADYVMTGSVNQATVEAGTSDLVKQMLADAAFTDVASGPAPDMFELGAKVQVLSRGAMYAARAQRLHELYRSYGGLDELPDAELNKLEKQILGRPVAEIWAECERYWGERDARQVEKAMRDGRHKMALVFRWYLGMTSRWARQGEVGRKRDFQIWCGPAMGAFNQWAEGGPLAEWSTRSVVGVAEALMAGTAVEARLSLARLHGVDA